MNREEHLRRIVTKCERLIAIHEDDFDGPEHAIAGWKSTIAAIDGLKQIDRENKGQYGESSDYAVDIAVEAVRNSIISTWPEELM